MFKVVYKNQYVFIPLNILLVLGCNIINLCCSCYLSFIMSPEWKFLCVGVGPAINYVIIIGKIIGGIISLFFSNDNEVNQLINQVAEANGMKVMDELDVQAGANPIENQQQMEGQKLPDNFLP